MIRMQRLCVGILLWVSLIGSLLAETPTSFEVRGTLRLPTGNGVVTTISLDGLLQSDLYQELLKELLENQHWYVDYVDEAHGCVISPEPQIKRGIYDIDASTATAIIDLTVAQTTHAGPVISVAMHPSGNFVLIGGTTAATGNHQSRIYALSSTGSALTAMSGCNQIYGGNVNGVAWHPSGNYYALVGTITAAQSRYNSLPIGGFGGSVVGVNPYVTEARIYGFDSERVTSTILPYAYIDHGATLTAVDWHPTGSYLAVSGPGGTGGYHIRVYSFNGAQLTQLANCNMSHDLSSTVIVGALSWHPSGEYLAIGGAPGTGSLDIRVYHFVNETLLEMLGARFDTGSTTSELAWSPDGTMLAAVTTGGTLQLFTFDDKLRLTSRSTAAHGAGLNSVAWSPDGAYIVVGGVSSASITSRVYQVQENTLTVIAACNKNHGATVWSTDWSPDGSFITVGGYSSGGFTLETYQFTEDIAFIVKKNKGMLYEIDSLVRDAYDAVVEAEETVYTTSDAMSTANRWYLKPNVSGSNISQGSWPWSIEGFSGYAEWQDFDAHPNGRVLAAISNLSASLDDGFLHIFDFDPESSYVNSPLIPRIVLAYPQSYDAVTIRTPEYIRWSPTGEYIIVGHGARGPGSADFTNAYITRIFNYDGTSLTAASTANFYSISDALASPNGSFILATSQTVPVRVFTYDGQYTQSFASVPFSNAGYTSNLQYVAWAPDGKSFAISVYNSSGGVLLTEQISFNSATGTLTELLGTQLSSFNGPIAFRPQVDPTDSRQYLATNQGIYLFNGIDANVPSYTFLPGTALSSPVILGWSRDGRYLATTGGIYEFVDNVSLLRKTAGVGGTSGPLPHASWLYDNKYILATPNVLYQLSQYSHQELLVDTSNAAAGLLVATSYAVVAAGGGSSALSISTSNAIVTYNRLAIETSNAVVTYNPLIIQTSNAVNAILPGTSNAMAQLERSTSNAIVTLAAGTGLNQTTSSAIVTLFSTLINTSNAMNNYQPIIIGTSNAVNGLLVDTSNAMAGLLVATSRAAAGLLVATSNAAAGLLVKDNVVAVSLAPYIAQLDTVDCGPTIHFNSATITLTYDLFISADHQLLIHTSGVVNGNGHAINFPRGVGTAMTLDPSVTITFQNTVLRNYVDARVNLGANAAVIFGQDCTVELGDAQDISRTWSFAGSSRIKGFNTRLGVGTGQNYIEVQPQSTLKLEDLFVTTVRNNNIRCLNNNSSIQLQNAELLLDSDFSWTVGSLRFSSDVTMRGTSIFNYTTRMGSTIDTGSRLTIDQGMSFNYAPSSNFRNLLVMTDSTSLLQMTNATLISTATGVQLTKGTLYVDGVMSIQSAAASSAEAVVFGDGAPANDLLVQLLPGANIQVTAGFLNYQNAN